MQSTQKVSSIQFKNPSHDHAFLLHLFRLTQDKSGCFEEFYRSKIHHAIRRRILIDEEPVGAFDFLYRASSIHSNFEDLKSKQLDETEEFFCSVMTCLDHVNFFSLLLINQHEDARRRRQQQQMREELMGQLAQDAMPVEMLDESQEEPDE